MSQQARVSHPIYSLLPTEIEGFDSLAELALNLRWSWNHATDEVWRQLDPKLWEITHNPWVVLQTVSRDWIERILADPVFRKNVDALVQTRRHKLDAPAWFQQNHLEGYLTCVAYFSMEFMLSEALPIYSGGLGNVAGDQLKTASDLGVPVVGVGLLYQQGYFRQVIDKDGAQQALYPYNDPGQLPITPLRQANGEWLRSEIALPGYSVWLRAWQVQVGRVKLYLLDSNDAANFPAHRGITSEPYGGGPELRLQQELLLGIGGWRLLHALGIQPEVCHLNEGHAALAILERARTFMNETAQPFEVALAVTRAGNLFTTHTAVPAGFDRFAPALIEQYLSRYAQEKLGITVHDLLALGRQNPNDSSESFNMAYLAIRGCGAVNGVSRLHGKVSRRLFEPLFLSWPEDEVPVGHVTNGVHMPSWDSAPADDLWTEACGKKRWVGTTETLEQDIRRVSDARLWQLRTVASKSLVEYARERLSGELAASGASPEAVDGAKHLFDPNALTLGFARRFATYKRPNLLLHDPERLLRLLTIPQRPVQLIIAGKAHPEDRAGQALIQDWIKFIRQREIRPHIIFLSDYDMLLAAHLVQGVDVWLNTPRRPWEASGTSGVKVLVNGGINRSELDGWWAEAYSPDLGWALGDGREHGDDPAWDGVEANALYDLLEREVIPAFYSRDQSGIPTAWVKRMRESMARLTPRFSANRTVREYTEQHYLTAAASYCERAANNGAMGKQLVDWQHGLEQKWATLHFGEVKVETRGAQHVLEVPVCLNDLDPEAVGVELYANGVTGIAPLRQELKRVRQLTGVSGRLRLQRGCICGTPATGLYGARDTALRRRCDPTGRRENPVAAMIGSTEEKMMKKATAITCVFLDIGGVLLTDGWDHHARNRAPTNLKAELTEVEERHHLTFETYEEDKLTLEEYLSRTVFYKERPCTRAQFREFMFAQSQSYPEMIELVAQLKVRHGLKITLVSNEARELNAYRIQKFKLDQFVDFFVSSCFVHLRKPDADIFRLALNVAHKSAEQVVYIENTPMFVQVAEGFGIRSALHTDYRSTCAKLALLGLPNDAGVVHEAG